jgi:hypothetical protein
MFLFFSDLEKDRSDIFYEVAPPLHPEEGNFFGIFIDYSEFKGIVLCFFYKDAPPLAPPTEGNFLWV